MFDTVSSSENGFLSEKFQLRETDQQLFTNLLIIPHGHHLYVNKICVLS